MFFNKNVSFLLVISLILFTFHIFAEESAFVSYRHPEGCYRIDLPKEWSVEFTDNDLAATSPAEDKGDTHFENLQLWNESLDEPTTLESYYRQSLANLKQRMSKFVLQEEGQGTFTTSKGDHIPARWFHALVKSGGVEGIVLQYQAVVGTRVYVLNFTAEASKYLVYAPTFQKIASSFRLDDECRE